MNAGSIEDDVPREKLSSHLQFSTPPSFSPKGIQEGTSPPSSILGASSSYKRNLASSNVPPLLSLSGDEETLLWPLLQGSNINSTGGSSLTWQQLCGLIPWKDVSGLIEKSAKWLWYLHCARISRYSFLKIRHASLPVRYVTVSLSIWESRAFQ